MIYYISLVNIICKTTSIFRKNISLIMVCMLTSSLFASNDDCFYDSDDEITLQIKRRIKTKKRTLPEEVSQQQNLAALKSPRIEIRPSRGVFIYSQSDEESSESFQTEEVNLERGFSSEAEVGDDGALNYRQRFESYLDSSSQALEATVPVMQVPPFFPTVNRDVRYYLYSMLDIKSMQRLRKVCRWLRYDSEGFYKHKCCPKEPLVVPPSCVSLDSKWWHTYHYQHDMELILSLVKREAFIRNKFRRDRDIRESGMLLVRRASLFYSGFSPDLTDLCFSVARKIATMQGLGEIKKEMNKGPIGKELVSMGGAGIKSRIKSNLKKTISIVTSALEVNSYASLRGGDICLSLAPLLESIELSAETYSLLLLLTPELLIDRSTEKERRVNIRTLMLNLFISKSRDGMLSASIYITKFTKYLFSLSNEPTIVFKILHIALDDCTGDPGEKFIVYDEEGRVFEDDKKRKFSQAILAGISQHQITALRTYQGEIPLTWLMRAMGDYIRSAGEEVQNNPELSWLYSYNRQEGDADKFNCLLEREVNSAKKYTENMKLEMS